MKKLFTLFLVTILTCHFLSAQNPGTFPVTVTSGVNNWAVLNVGDDFKPAGYKSYNLLPGSYTFAVGSGSNFSFDVSSTGVVTSSACPSFAACGQGTLDIAGLPIIVTSNVTNWAVLSVGDYDCYSVLPP